MSPNLVTNSSPNLSPNYTGVIPRSVPICVPMLKVFDFSADNDHEPDSNGEFTSASLKAGFLPESFTICSAIMVDAWTTVFSSAEMFILLNVNGDQWGYVSLYAATGYTEQGGTSCG